MKTISRHCFGLVVFLTAFLYEDGLAMKGGSSNFRFLARRPQPLIKSVPLGSSLTINCSTNDPTATTTIHRKKSSRWIKLTPGANLAKIGNDFKLLHLGLFDSGHYKCRASNSKGAIIEWPNKNGLLVIGYRSIAPKVTVSPNYQVVLKAGQNTRFTCSSAPRTQLQWFKVEPGRKDRLVAAHQTVRKRNQNSNKLILTITNAQKADSGFYKCVMKFRNSNREKYASLKVNEFRFMARRPQALVKGVPLGSSFTINCSTNDPTATTTIHRKKSSRWIKLKPGANLAKTGNDFKLLYVGLFDSGYYKCRSSNSNGAIIEWPNKNGLLVIGYRNIVPKLTLSPNHEVVLRDGQNASFTCSSAPHTHLQWFKVEPRKKDRLVAAHQIVSKRNQNSNKLILTITNAQKADSGFYKCVMKFRNSNREKYASLKMNGSPPKPRSSRGSSTSVLKVSESSRVVMKSSVIGYPLPKITWYKDGTLIGCVKNGSPCSSHPQFIIEEGTKNKNGQHFVRSKLKLGSSRRTRDKGVYTCRAKNQFGDVLIHTYKLVFN